MGLFKVACSDGTDRYFPGRTLEEATAHAKDNGYIDEKPQEETNMGTDNGLFEPINLDGFTVDETERIADTLHAMAEYAECKARAAKKRLAGRMQSALHLEEECQAIYSGLPVWARW